MQHRTIATSAVSLILGLAALGGCGSPATTDQTPAPMITNNDPAPDQPPIDNGSPVSLRVYAPGKEGTPLISSTKSTWEPLGLQDDGSIEVPPEPTPLKLGWYCPGRVDNSTKIVKRLTDGNCAAPVPGSLGPAVVIGHINGDGHDGVFRHLDQVKVNDVIDVGRNDGKIVRFVVSETGMPVKTAFPTDKIYGNTAGPEIRLISCGGRLDPRYAEGVQFHRYIDQVIVWGKLSPEQPRQ